MSLKVRVAGWLMGVLFCSLTLTYLSRSAASQTETSAPRPSPSPMEKVFGNIQVLKGIPSTELLPIMNFMRASLGVRCDFCHVAENGKYRLDEKKEKLRAREMILMTRRLNDGNFGGGNVVTCNTCHRGSTSPLPIPSTGSDFVNTTRREPFEPQPPPLPSIAEVLARYENATHLSSVKSAHLKLEGCHAKVVDAGTYGARVIPRAACNVAESLIDFDEKGARAVTTSPQPDGKSVRVGSDGRRGWTVGPNGLQWIRDEDFVQFQRKLDPLLAMCVRARDFASAHVSGVEVINGRETYVLTAVGIDGIGQKLWFSIDDGLLVRRTFYHPMALGLDPEQIDLSDYRGFDMIKLPTRINTTYLDDQHLGVLKTLLEVKLGVSVSDQDFVPPNRWPN